MGAGNRPSAAIESVYVVPGELSAEAVTSSLQALLSVRHHRIAQNRFTVLDTFDGRIRRAAACLTSSEALGTTTVAWRTRGGGSCLATRLNQPVSFAWDFPDGPLKQVLAQVIGPRRLLAQADAEECGSLLEILDDRGKTVARLRIASGQVRLPMPHSVWRPLPTMITLIGLRGYEDAYARLAPVIESRPGITSCPDGLLGMMLRQVGAPVRGDLSSLRVDLAPTVRADVGARQIHAALLGILLANEPGLRANLDTEFLHDFRVAVRRTRSLLGQIKRVFRPEIVHHFSSEFTWIGRLTGPPRDMDVLTLALRERREEFSAADMEGLIACLSQAQQQEYDRLFHALGSHRYQQLLSDWKAFLEEAPESQPEARNAGEPLAEVVSKRAWRLSRRIARNAETISGHAAAERLHEVRIDAKKLRYLIDVTPTFYDEAALDLVLRALKKLQRVLGEFNDAHVQENRLLECGRGLYAAGGPAGVVLALGRLAEKSRRRRERLRGDVVEKLARFRAKDTRAACRRAFKGMRSKEPVP
jgi:CHAD domain-containing protein